MDTKYKLINNAQTNSNALSAIAENFKVLATSIKAEPKKLMEDATHILAGVREKMSAGEKLETLGISPRSLALVVAGLEYLSNNLDKMEPVMKQRIVKVLSHVAFGPRLTLGAAQAIAGFARKNPRVQEYVTSFVEYGETGQSDPTMIRMIGMIQQKIDGAIRAGDQDLKRDRLSAGTPTSTNYSSAVGSTGQSS